MVDDFGLQSDVKPSVIGRFPEVFTLEEQSVDENEIWSHLEGVVREAAEKFVESRVREGENLKKDLLAKLSAMSDIVAYIEEKSPQIIEDYKARLIEKCQYSHIQCPKTNQHQIHNTKVSRILYPSIGLDLHKY